MPSGDRPEWTTMFAHVCRECGVKHPALEHVALRLTPADVEALRDGSPHAPPHRARADYPVFVVAAARNQHFTANGNARGLLSVLCLSAEQQNLSSLASLPASLDEMAARFQRQVKLMVTQAKSSTAVVLVDLDDDSVPDYGWIPTPLPAYMRVVVFAPTGKGHEQALNQLSLAAGFAFHHISMPTLTIDESVSLFSSMLSAIKGEYPSDGLVRTALSQFKDGGNALYLRLAAGLASFDKTSLETLSSFPPTLLDLLFAILDRADRDHPKAARAMLVVQSLSNHALSIKDVVARAVALDGCIKDCDVLSALNGVGSVLLYAINRDKSSEADAGATWLLHSTIASAIQKK